MRRAHILLVALLVASASSVTANAAEAAPRDTPRMHKRIQKGRSFSLSSSNTDDDHVLFPRLFGGGGTADQSNSGGTGSAGSAGSTDQSTGSGGSGGSTASQTSSAAGGSGGAASTSSAAASSSTSRSGGLFGPLTSVQSAASSSAAAGASSSAAAAASSSQDAASRSQSRASASAAAASSSLLATSTNQAGETVIVTSIVPAASSTDAAASASSSSSSSSEDSGNHTPLIIGVSVVGGLALLGGLIFLATRFWGKRSGFDDHDADIKWPELKHGGDDAAMQPLPARRTGGAGFDMGEDEISEAGGHNIMHQQQQPHSMAHLGGPAPDYSPPLDGASMTDGGYGPKLTHHDSFAASTTQLTGPGAMYGGGGGGATAAAPMQPGGEYGYHDDQAGYYDPYGQQPSQQQHNSAALAPGVNYAQQPYSDHDPHIGAGIDDEYASYGAGYGAHGNAPHQSPMSNPYR